MIKVENGIASRAPIPDFLQSPYFLVESLLDLSWTDSSYGVQGAAWWPEEDVSGELGPNKKWGAEVLTLDAERQVVLVKRKQVAMTAGEKAARDEELTAQWADQIAARRFQVETGGVTVAGVQINTDRDSQSLLTGAAFAASIDPDYRIKWKAETGFVDLKGEQILGIASEVRAFVQSCFDRESELLNEVKNGTIELSMLETGWPG